MLEEELEKISGRLFKGIGFLKEKEIWRKNIQERFVFYFANVAVDCRNTQRLYSDGDIQ